jgi:hypothetical protein
MTLTTTFSPRPAADFSELSRAGEGRPATSSVESGGGRFRPGFLGETTCPVPFGRPARTGPLFAKVSGPHPDPHRLSSLTLDHAFGGSSTLDFRPWTRWKVSRPAWQRPFQAAGAHPERLCHKPASVNLPRQAAGKESRVSTRLETTRKFSSIQKLATEEEAPGGPAAVECASRRCLTPLGLKRDQISSAPRSQAGVALRPGL